MRKDRVGGPLMGADGAAVAAREAPARLPGRYWLFVGAEMAERASFIGVATILAGFANGPLGLPAADAALLVSAFLALTYLAPLAGGWLGDRRLGPWRTLLGACTVCLCGHLLLGLALLGPMPVGQAALGLALVALGAGAIKAVAPVLAGTAAADASGMIPARAFGTFYAAINLAALAASLGMPLLRDRIGYHLALLVPSIVLACALLMLARLRPSIPADGPGGQGGKLPPILVRLLPALALYYLVLYQGYASWVLFIGRSVDLRVGSATIPPEWFLAINPLVVISLAPVLDRFLHQLPAGAALRQPAARIRAGLILSAIGPLLMAGAALLAAAGVRPGPGWPAFATLAMALAEVLIAVSALQLAAGAEDPGSRGRATGLFYLAIAIGNILGGLLVGVLGVPMDARGFGLQVVLLLLGAALGALALGRSREMSP